MRYLILIVLKHNSQVASLNILRVMFQESAIANEVQFLAEDLLASIIQGFGSESWQLRNACTVAFGVVVPRIFGIKKTRDELDFENSISVRELFIRFELLVQIFKH